MHSTWRVRSIRCLRVAFAAPSDALGLWTEGSRSVMPLLTSCRFAIRIHFARHFCWSVRQKITSCTTHPRLYLVPCSVTTCSMGSKDWIPQYGFPLKKCQLLLRLSCNFLLAGGSDDLSHSWMCGINNRRASDPCILTSVYSAVVELIHVAGIWPGLIRHNLM